MVIEGWHFMDALYMTVITIAAVGYREVNAIGPAGRIFTIILVVGGVGFTVYIAAAIVQFMVEGRIRVILGRRRLDHKISRLKNHFIVCGYGRIGRVLALSLKEYTSDLIVIDMNPDLIPVMEDDGVLFISGEATTEANLERAGIKKAKGLIAALATDTDNVFLVLTARQLAPNLHITARASGEDARSKLLAAGASYVESPYEKAAVMMAHRIIRPTVTSFLDLAFAHQYKDIQMEEIPVSPSSELANLMLKDSGIRQKYNLIIIAIKKSDGSMHFNPSFEHVISSGDTVVAVGQVGNLQQLEKVLNVRERPQHAPHVNECG
jgi:voltage-gated potassium channel